MLRVDRLDAKNVMLERPNPLNNHVKYLVRLFFRCIFVEHEDISGLIVAANGQHGVIA
ncbi:hypothetical protein D3C75_1159290 [compost metagenome]